jgi:oligopeptide/dipeptide ABC transporter ATP-binding protein
MYLGRIVEIGPTRQVLARPTHPYTKALLSVIPVPNPRLRHDRWTIDSAPPVYGYDVQRCIDCPTIADLSFL